jgi:hypothetical protein
MKEKDKVFVSYTVRDNLIDNVFLNELNIFLDKSFRVFIDFLHNDSDDKQTRIESEIAKADFFILIKTNQTFDSEWVIKEIALAKKFSIPIFEFDYDNIKNNDFSVITVTHKQWRGY